MQPPNNHIANATQVCHSVLQVNTPFLNMTSSNVNSNIAAGTKLPSLANNSSSNNAQSVCQIANGHHLPSRLPMNPPHDMPSSLVSNVANQNFHNLKRTSKHVISRLTEANNPDNSNSEYLFSNDSSNTPQHVSHGQGINANPNSSLAHGNQ